MAVCYHAPALWCTMSDQKTCGECKYSRVSQFTNINFIYVWCELLESYVVKHDRSPCKSLKMAQILRDEVKRLKKENFELAAWQCVFLDGSGLTDDENGNQYCSKDVETKRLRRVAKKDIERAKVEAVSRHEEYIKGMMGW